MKRSPTTFTIMDIWSLFIDIEFPEYQREPNIWSREQKQRLMDSIIRQFDIASIYFTNVKMEFTSASMVGNG